MWAVGDRYVAVRRALFTDAVGGETLAEHSRALIRLHQRIEGAAPTMAERQALVVLGDGALKHQFVVGVRDGWVRHELRRLVLRSADRPFIVVREEALCLMCEEEARAVQMCPVVEKAAPALSGPVGGSVSNLSVGDLSVDMELCGVDTVLSSVVSGRLCDLDRVSEGGDTDASGVDTVSGAVSGGLCDLDRVSGGGDTDASGVDTVSGAVSGGLCDLDRVSGGGDTDVSGVDTVVSGAVSVCLCDLDSVSPDAMVVRVGETMLSGGDVVTVVSGVDVLVCGVSSVMTAGELDVCCCGSLVSDATGDVVSVDDVVACGDDPLLPDAVRVGGRLSVVGDTLVCDSGVARSSTE